MIYSPTLLMKLSILFPIKWDYDLVKAFEHFDKIWRSINSTVPVTSAQKWSGCLNDAKALRSLLAHCRCLHLFQTLVSTRWNHHYGFEFVIHFVNVLSSYILPNSSNLRRTSLLNYQSILYTNHKPLYVINIDLTIVTLKQYICIQWKKSCYLCF